jgi:hypothetical protein
VKNCHLSGSHYLVPHFSKLSSQVRIDKNIVMKANIFLAGFILSVLFSCHKQSGNMDNPKGRQDNPHSFVALKLKNITIGSLPAPYYHFEYSNNNHISSFNFGNGLLYDMQYKGDDLTLMTNNSPGTTKDRIEYNYINNQIAGINITTEGGLLYHRALLTYYPSGQLQMLVWELKTDSETFSREQSFTFSYYPDSNVREIVHQYFEIGAIPPAVFTERYESYDKHKNTDGFTLVHASLNQYKPPILLPDIVLQVNNPGRVVRSGGAAVDYEVSYDYEYDGEGRPVKKTGHFLYTSGAEAGRQEDVQTVFSYYE